MPRVVRAWIACLLVAASASAQANAEPALRIERELFVRGGYSVCLAWSADGKWIASAGQCGEVLLLSAETGAVVHELEAEPGPCGVGFAADGHTLVVVGRDQSHWNVATGALRERHSLPPPGESVDSLVGPREASAAAVRIVGEARRSRAGWPVAVRWDGCSVQAGAGELQFHHHEELQRRVPLPHRQALEGAVLTADGRYCMAYRGEALFLLEVSTGRSVALPPSVAGRPLPYHAGPEIVLWSPGGAARAHDSGTRLTWWSGDALRAGHEEPVRTFDLGRAKNRSGCLPYFSRDGRHVGHGNQVFDLLRPGRALWTAPGIPFDGLQPHDGAAEALVVYSVSSCMGMGFGNGWVEAVRSDGTVIGKTRMGGYVHWADYSPDGRHLGMVTERGIEVLTADGLVSVSRTSGQLLGGAAAWVDDDRLLVAHAEPTLLELHDTHGPLLVLPLSGLVQSVAVARDGQRAIAAMNDRIVVLHIAR